MMKNGINQPGQDQLLEQV